MSEEEEGGVITRSIFDFKNNSIDMKPEEKPPGSPLIRVASRRGSKIGLKTGSRKGSHAGSRRNSQDEEEIISQLDGNVAIELIERLIKENETSKRRSIGK